MESNSHLADKSPYYRLPFLCKSAARQLLNSVEMTQRRYPEAEEATFFPFPFSLSSASSFSSLKSNLIPRPVYLVNKRDEEEEERKSFRGARSCVNAVLPVFTGFHAKLQKPAVNNVVMINSSAKRVAKHINAM